jgi:hypothetical protein
MESTKILKTFLFIQAAILILGSVSCAQPDKLQSGELTINIDRNEYLPTMSSAVGIGLIPAYKIESTPEDIKCRWRTNYGYFVAWDAPDFEVKILGPAVINTGEKIYWSYDPNERGVNKPSVLISLHIENRQTQQVVAETNIEVGWEDHDTAIVMSR